MNLLDDFEIVIRRRPDRVIAMIPRLSLYAVGNDTPSALASLDSKKKALEDDLIDAGVQPDDLDPRINDNRRSGPHPVLLSLTLFAAKTGIVVGLLLVAVAIGATIAQPR